MKALLTKPLSIYTYDKTTILLKVGSSIIVNQKTGIAESPDYPQYPFDILESEYTLMWN